MRPLVDPRRLLCSVSFTMALLLVWQPSFAGPIRDFLSRHGLAKPAEAAETANPRWLPSGTRLVPDVPYGKDSRQRMDIYLPRKVAGAPVIFMVHGGGWQMGDKGARNVVKNKVTRWVTRGFIFISTNYRLVPQAGPVEQSQDIVRALAAAQRQVAALGADPSKFILMGHSAGAHLVALVDASGVIDLSPGVKPWLGAVLLDSGALDVVRIMEGRHPRFYDRVFGSDRVYWKAASPFDALTGAAAPFLAVCSQSRKDSCAQASRFVAKATSLKVRASTLAVDMSHGEINQELGVEGHYTLAVESFMSTLDASVRRLLAGQSSEGREN